MQYIREFFPKVKKTIMPRPVQKEETDVLGQRGVAFATQAIIYGSNWYNDKEDNLIAIYDAGPALCFKDILPKKDKYAREGLYLQLTIAYRTTPNANVNIRTFSGNHVTLPNSVKGAMYVDPFTYYWITDDMTINVNSIYINERLWIQRVEWEWISKDILFEDEIGIKDIHLTRSKKDVEALYMEKEITRDMVKRYLINLIKNNDHFARQCLVLLNSNKLLEQDIVTLYKNLGIKET